MKYDMYGLKRLYNNFKAEEQLLIFTIRRLISDNITFLVYYYDLQLLSNSVVLWLLVELFPCKSMMIYTINGKGSFIILRSSAILKSIYYFS